MTAFRPPRATVVASTLSVVPPLTLLTLSLITVLPVRLNTTTMAVAAATIAAWGARTGVLGPGRRRGLAWRGLVQLARLAGVVAASIAVRVASLGAPPSQPDALSVVTFALLFFVFLSGRTVGRIHRRQADPMTTAGAHRTADAALVAVLVTGTVLVIAITVGGWTIDALVPPARWFPLLWLLVTVATVVAARPTVLHARTATSDLSSGGGWLAALSPIAGALLIVAALITLLLVTGVGAAVRDAVPGLPALQLDLFDGISEAGSVRPASRAASDRDPAWLVVLVVIVVLSLVVWPTARRRRRRQRPVGAGISLLMFLRSLVGAGRASKVVVDEETELDAPPPEAAGARPIQTLPPWIARLRPRPREPAAAILHDYRRVQRRLPERRRRRPSETVLAHAARTDVDELGELAGLVCAIRYAGWRPKADDADRSQELARVVLRGR